MGIYGVEAYLLYFYLMSNSRYFSTIANVIITHDSEISGTFLILHYPPIYYFRHGYNYDTLNS